MSTLKLASKIFKRPIVIPANIVVTQHFKSDLTRVFSFEGPLGTLSLQLPNYLIHHLEIVYDLEGSISAFHVSNTLNLAMNSHDLHRLIGLMYRTMQNIFIGVTRGYQNILRLVGTGFRVKVKKASLARSGFRSRLKFKLGYSHRVSYKLPPTVNIMCPTHHLISIFGVDIHQVTLMTSLIRSLRLPDVYKGKGIRYANISKYPLNLKVKKQKK